MSFEFNIPCSYEAIRYNILRLERRDEIPSDNLNETTLSLYDEILELYDQQINILQTVADAMRSVPEEQHENVVISQELRHAYDGNARLIEGKIKEMNAIVLNSGYDF